MFTFQLAGSARTVPQRRLAGFLAGYLLPMWLVLGAVAWQTWLPKKWHVDQLPDVDRTAFWTLFVGMAGLTVALLAACARRVEIDATTLTVRYVLRPARRLAVADIEKTLWLPHFRSWGTTDYGLLLAFDHRRRRHLRLDTRIFGADDLSTLAAQAPVHQVISKRIKPREMRRSSPNALPLLDNRPILVPVLTLILLAAAALGVLMGTGLLVWGSAL